MEATLAMQRSRSPIAARNRAGAFLGAHPSRWGIWAVIPAEPASGPQGLRPGQAFTGRTPFGLPNEPFLGRCDMQPLPDGLVATLLIETPPRPALFAGGPYIGQLWLFWLAPIVGAVIAGLLTRWMYEAEAIVQTTVVEERRVTAPPR